MSYFYFDNKKVYYNESGEGTPLLLLHGNTASSKMFDGIAEQYKKQFKVILIDFLGHGKSDRLEDFSNDLWFYEAEQVIAFLKEKNYTNVNIIGSSGGALVAINVALEAPERINKVIADSFEGEKSIAEFTTDIVRERELSKKDDNAKMFYSYMHGMDWEKVVDNDTKAIVQHSRERGNFFHKQIELLKADILLTGSKKDEFVSDISTDFFENTYGELINKIGHGKVHLFNEGGHPAMLSNKSDFYKLSLDFFKQ